ncbi:MAG: tetratricopeptide repeat protein [Gammaproteobacteria bacterium]|nr:tetratricopeptide repeat protein [Gammaproteobacteria bacterium]
MEHEEEQLEKIREWWQKNGKALILGVIAAIITAVVVQMWMKDQREHTETASAEYAQLLQYIDSDQVKAAGLADRIISDYDGTIYATMAALLQARLAAEKNDWDKAAASLNWAMENSDDEGLAHIARLRLARVLMQQDKTDAALALLVDIEQGAFSADYQELLGDIYLLQGNKDKARAAYAKAVVLSTAGSNNRLLQIKLDDLAAESKETK